ncbi:MAG: HAD hydrolase family protein, partial [Oscillospiraceae bacterium]|nr:HAD hydrolase family protein [Oscillospiraceae bacterium]
TEKRRFEALGGKFIMATGRSADSARPYAKQLELKYPSVYHNGASIYDYSSEKYVATMPILRDEGAGFFAELMLRFPEVGLEAASTEGHFMLAGGEVAYLHASMEKGFTKSDIAGTPKKWLKALVSGSAENVEAAYRFGLEKAPKSIRVVKSSEWFCEFIAADVNKFSSAVKIMEILGQPIDKSCGIGDYYNDVELFAQSTIGAVPASAPEEIRRLAPHVVCPCDEGALADFILYIENLIDEGKI